MLLKSRLRIVCIYRHIVIIKIVVGRWASRKPSLVIHFSTHVVFCRRRTVFADFFALSPSNSISQLVVFEETVWSQILPVIVHMGFPTNIEDFWSTSHSQIAPSQAAIVAGVVSNGLPRTRIFREIWLCTVMLIFRIKRRSSARLVIAVMISGEVSCSWSRLTVSAIRYALMIHGADFFIF